MDNKEERCIICGDRFDSDDEKIYCPECGAPMHKDCYEVEGSCPNTAGHRNRDNAPGSRIFPDGDGCEICGKPFDADDERVYCPDCGAPMHRLCYNMTHQCPYQSTHTPRPTINRATRTINGKPVCDKCGKELDNGEDKVYCPICGTPVHKSCWDEDPVCPNESRHAEGFDWEKVNKKPEQSNPAKEFYARRTIDPAAYENFQDMIENHPILSPESGEELTCRGVKQKELIHFLGMNNFSTPRFFTLFMNMANGGKVLSLNLSAWFFVPLYHYYRRMTGPAVILTLATFILTIPSLMYQVLFFREMSTEIPDLQFGTLVTVTSYIMIVFRVVLLLFNDYFYMRWSVNKILALRERYKDAPADEYYEALERKGNPKMLFVLGGISLMLFLVYILNIFISYTGIV